MLLNLMFLVFVSRIDSQMATLERKQSDVRSSSLTKNHEARRDLTDVGEIHERNKRATGDLATRAQQQSGVVRTEVKDIVNLCQTIGINNRLSEFMKMTL